MIGRSRVLSIRDFDFRHDRNSIRCTMLFIQFGHWHDGYLPPNFRKLSNNNAKLQSCRKINLNYEVLDEMSWSAVVFDRNHPRCKYIDRMYVSWVHGRKLWVWNNPPSGPSTLWIVDNQLGIPWHEKWIHNEVPSQERLSAIGDLVSDACFPSLWGLETSLDRWLHRIWEKTIESVWLHENGRDEVLGDAMCNTADKMQYQVSAKNCELVCPYWCTSGFVHLSLEFIVKAFVTTIARDCNYSKRTTNSSSR